ncbi:DUF2399 domain-containing protein [Aquitalea palustris]|uniref:DUF2399 domain-containing protein n=1 Tax=Aquitalea palustris TaxID=2480983 RepID=A0A454JLL9_9NEIS|nr:DUF2399 domain-containing protein [Aquitalea palustris]RMD00788.1 DUF2399 domain-containing protein [Aquitalea palustris]
MSSWLARISPELVERLPIGARGHHLLLQPTLAPTPLLLPQADQALLQRWLALRVMRQRWTSLLGQGSDAAQAEDLLRRLLECGWCEVELHAEPGRLGQWEPFWVSWREVYQLRSLIGLPDADARDEVVQLWRGWQPQNAILQGLADSLAQRLQSSTLERRLKIAQALDGWLSAGLWGTERQFSQYALGRSKAFGEADRRWLAEFGIALEACGISRHTPHVFLSGPLELYAAGQLLLSAGLLQSGLALAPEALQQVDAIRGPLQMVRIVENLSVFEVLTRQAEPVLTIWVPGYPHRRWLQAVGHLLAVLRLPVQVACDLDPAGVAIALQVGELAGQAGCAWQPWRMQADELTLAHGGQPLKEEDQQALARLARLPLPPMLADLCAAMLERQLKVEQEALFIGHCEEGQAG